MKPLGPIPPGYAGPGGALAVAGHDAEALVAMAGDTPAFVYSLDYVRARIAALRSALPNGVEIHYAIKANPLPALVENMIELVDGFDVASGGELARLGDLGIEGGRISFAGPGKRDDELAAAIRAGVTLNCESEGEVGRALAQGAALATRPQLAIRVNPPFDLKGSGMKMGGGARPFGVDADRVPALARHILAAGADWRGLHIFAGSQSLDSAAIIAAQRATVALAGELAEAIGTPPPACNLGGGFGIPYFAGDTPIDLAAIGGALAQALAQRPASLAGTRFCIELGRYIVGEAGVYLTRVVDRKESHGATFLVVDGGMHHQLAASGNFGTVVRRNYPVAVAARMCAPGEEEEVSVVGCLCTPLDRLADSALLPRADVGDLIAVFCAGAYGASASPAAFLGHPPAREIVVGS
ncbi:pyridoxal-dependent decarboxylase, exosortase A system-associated [Parablastomonas sp. CN1-191]|uniref:pyridoxal-dependent decarboxylase, exosortase A system-associated n=1 Tax=Parablastomonas sp. CN1-191 TaxID=3400908 RepID=UPI003BF91FEC